MPNVIKFGSTRASRQYGEMCTLHTFYILSVISWEAPHTGPPRGGSEGVSVPGPGGSRGPERHKALIFASPSPIFRVSIPIIYAKRIFLES